jgi:hypothetical protein
MSANLETATVSRKALWTGRALSGLAVLGLLFSAGMKFAAPEEVVTQFEQLGYPKHLLRVIGILELACTLIYLVPQTAVLGAILLTAYLGGATATHVRVEDGSWFSPVIGGVIVWLGLLLREPRLRPLLPLRR